MASKKDDGGPKLKRDANNRLDQDDVSRVSRELTERLITTERQVQKDMSFRNVRGTKRDVYIAITVCQRNSVNGQIVLGDTNDPRFEKWDDRDPFSYRAIDATHIEMLAREIPMKMQLGERFIMGAWAHIRQTLIKMNVINSA